MLKVFIADDDKIVRLGLKTIITENLKNEVCEIVGEASNGFDALEFLKKYTVDLLITDIKMPVMDGVELIKEIVKEQLNVKVLVLSGYDEYQFVRETLKYGASDYILKPIENRVLIDIIERLIVDINNEKRDIDNAKLLEKNIVESTQLIKEKYISEIIFNWNENTYIKARELQIKETSRHYIAVAQIDGIYRMKISEQFQATKLQNIKEFCTNYSSEYLTVFAIQKNRHIIIMLNGTQDISKELYKEYILIFFEQMINFIKDVLNISVTVGLSEEINSLDRAYMGYHQALLALERLFYLGTDKIIKYDPKECCYEIIEEKNIYKKTEELIGAIQCLDVASARKLSFSIFDLVEEGNISSHHFKEVIVRVLNQISSASLELREEIEGYKINGCGIVFYISELDTLKELRSYFNEFISALTNKLKLTRAERSQRVIEVAKDFILKNYSSNIGLNSVAEFVHLNPTYLSELFKLETGLNFIDFLVETRINAAKKLLMKSDLKVYEVGQKVGYEEPVSFNRAFKRVVGISPQEYRNILS